jgi:hypothetical protein
MSENEDEKNSDLYEVKLALVEPIARAFHEAYERLAPAHGYTTRKESAKPWSEVPKSNRDLMTATVLALFDQGTIAWVAPAASMEPFPMSSNDQVSDTLKAKLGNFTGLREYPLTDDPEVIQTFLPEGGTDEYPGHLPEAEAEPALHEASPIPGYWNLLSGNWAARRVDGLRIDSGAFVIKGPAHIVGPCDWWSEFEVRGGLKPEATSGWRMWVPSDVQSEEVKLVIVQSEEVKLVIAGGATLLEAIRAVDRLHPPPSWVKVSS